MSYNGIEYQLIMILVINCIYMTLAILKLFSEKIG